METSENNFQSSDSIIIGEEIKGFLLETTKWSKFLSILGFIGLGLMVLLSVIMFFLSTELGGFSGRRGGTGWMALIYIVFAVLYFFPINYLFRFSLSIKQGISSNNQNLLTSGFENLKSHYKFVGILTIVILSIYVLVFLLGILMYVTRFHY